MVVVDEIVRELITMTIDLHPRTIRRRIWKALLSATDQEIRDGLDFYPGAHGLCRLFSLAYKVTIRQAAGVYAALSPMNGWYTNVANTLAVIRHVCNDEPFTGVNTSRVNRDKAFAIASGQDPELVLRGRKVIAFYRGIADPSDTTSIPVDRHLICLAIGQKITRKQELRSLAGNEDLYLRIESVYHELGNREGIGNRLASIAWFVQRRINGTMPIIHPSALVCCNIPMWSHGRKHGRRFYCPTCGKTKTVQGRRSKTIEYIDGFPVRADSRGRKTIYLGRNHEFANSGGWQYLSRYIVMKELGERLRTDEHVHHNNWDSKDDRISNYGVLNASYHGRLHASAVELAGCRDKDGRFKKYDDPRDIYSWPRFGAVLGPAALIEMSK